MTNAEIIAAVNRWQSSTLHPLTCGNDSQKHRILVPIERDGEVVLACQDCEYRQEIRPHLLAILTSLVD